MTVTRITEPDQKITPCHSSYPGDAARSDGQSFTISHRWRRIPISSYSPCMSGNSPYTIQSALMSHDNPPLVDVPPVYCNVSSLDNHMMPEQQPDMDQRTRSQPRSRL
jgi:hypothetical protein